MSRLRVPVGITLGAVAAVTLIASPVFANCGNTRLFGTATRNGWSYIYTPGIDAATSESQLSVGVDFEGRFWALGAGDPSPGIGIDSGTFPLFAGFDSETGFNDDWSITDAGYPLLIQGHWAQSHEIDGCIDAAGAGNGIDGDECMVILLDDRNESAGYFALLTALVMHPVTWEFNQPGNAPITLAPMPAPRVLQIEHESSARLAVTIEPPAIEDGFYLDPACADVVDLLLGYRVYQWRTVPGGPPPTDPAIDAGWFGAPDAGVCGEPVFVPIDEDAVTTVTCAEDSDIYLAVTLMFESGFETRAVSASTDSIACGPCPDGTDADGDGYCSSAAARTPFGRLDGSRGRVGSGPPIDCDDHDAGVFPGAEQQCDGVNNDCRDPSWPVIPDAESDDDGDGYIKCAARVLVELDRDCDDESATRRPGAIEACNGIDDDCDELIDEGAVEVDEDGDGIPGACDNCPGTPNAVQADEDGDGLGDACDLCTDRDGDGFGDPGSPDCPRGAERDCADGDDAIHAGAPEIYDGRDNDCDGVPDQGLDDDGDGIPNLLDRCPMTPTGSLVNRFGCRGRKPGSRPN